MCSCGGSRPKPPAPPVVACKPHSITDVIAKTPKLSELPEKISIPPDVCKKMQANWDKSIDASGNSEEHGGTIALDKDGKMVIVNEGSGGSGTFSPNTTVPADHTYKGTFHTHPYGKNDGDLDGAHTTFSGGDLGTLDDYKEDVSMLQSGNNKYVIVKTAESPATLDNAKIESERQKIRDDEYAKLIKAGKKPPEAWGLACDKATEEMLKKMKYGYYKGTDCASLSRVSP